MADFASYSTTIIRLFISSLLRWLLLVCNISGNTTDTIILPSPSCPTIPSPASLPASSFTLSTSHIRPTPSTKPTSTSTARHRHRYHRHRYHRHSFSCFSLVQSIPYIIFHCLYRLVSFHYSPKARKCQQLPVCLPVCYRLVPSMSCFLGLS